MPITPKHYPPEIKKYEPQNHMNYDFIQDYCLLKPGAEEDYKEEWDAIRYTVRGKMFAMVGNDASDRGIITMKHTPEHGEELREKYPDIIPGYYMNKTHWSSVFLNGQVPEDVLKKMLDESHQLVFESLSKKVQKEIIMKRIISVLSPRYDGND